MRTYVLLGYLTILGNLQFYKVSASTGTHRDIYFEDGGSGDGETTTTLDPLYPKYPPDEDVGSGSKSDHYDYDAETEDYKQDYDKEYEPDYDQDDYEGEGSGTGQAGTGQGQQFPPPDVPDKEHKHLMYDPPPKPVKPIKHEGVDHEDDFRLVPETNEVETFDETLVLTVDKNSPSLGETPDRMPSSTPPPTLTDTHTDMDSSIRILTQKDDERQVSIFAQPGILAAFIGGAVMGLLCAILLVMFIVYRMRKRDEGSYPLDEPKRVPLTSSYAPNDKEIYA